MSELKAIETSRQREDLACYGFDASTCAGQAAMVAWPKSASEVSRLMRHAAAEGMSVICRGAGTGMTGGSVPTGRAAMVMSFEKMARLLEVDRTEGIVVVEPGMINGHLQRELEAQGHFYPPDPASMNFCTLGGNVAENAGGPRAVKYGVTRDYVMRVEAVLPSGEAIVAGAATHKGVVGYDLARLLVGSEGTLAAITKIQFKVLPLPEAVATLLVLFARLEDAGRAVAGIMGSGVVPRTLELMDRAAVHAVECYRPAGLPSDVDALLLVELDGAASVVEREAERVADICEALSGTVRRAATDAERQSLWQSRRAVSPALHHMEMRKINEDVVVPRARLTEMLVYLRDLSGQSGFPIVNFGHAGDGNIHVNIMCPKGDEELYKRATALVRVIFSHVLELGGTISGEHGVGLTKAAYMGMEIKEREMRVMRGIKALFDPTGMMNPGKVFG